MDSKVLVIAVVAIVAAAGWGVAGYSMLSQSDSGSNSSEPADTTPNYGAGYEMKATAKWVDGGSTTHTGHYTFTTLTKTNTSLNVKVNFTEGSESYESTIAVSKVDDTHYTSTVGVIGTLNAEYDGTENVWKIGTIILSRSQDDNILYRLYEVSASAYFSYYGAYTMTPADLFDPGETLAHMIVLNQRSTNGLFIQDEVVKANGTHSRFNIIAGDNMIRSDDISILTESSVYDGKIVAYGGMDVGGQPKACFDYYYDEDPTDADNIFTHWCYCDSGTLLCKLVIENMDTGIKTDMLTIDSIVYA